MVAERPGDDLLETPDNLDGPSGRSVCAGGPRRTGPLSLRHRYRHLRRRLWWTAAAHRRRSLANGAGCDLTAASSRISPEEANTHDLFTSNGQASAISVEC